MRVRRRFEGAESCVQNERSVGVFQSVLEFFVVEHC